MKYQKKLLSQKILLTFLFFVLFTGITFSQDFFLDEAITHSVRSMEELLPQGSSAAILDFNSPSLGFSHYVLEELTAELVAGNKIILLDRVNLSDIIGEIDLQNDGYLNDAFFQNIGRQLGVQAFITGALVDTGPYFSYRIRIINVETTVIRDQISYLLRNDALLEFLLNTHHPVEKRNLPISGSRPQAARTEAASEPAAPASAASTETAKTDASMSDASVTDVTRSDNAASGASGIETTRSNISSSDTSVFRFRKNRILADVSLGFDLNQDMGFGAGARIEKVIGPRLSLGAGFYMFQALAKDNTTNFSNNAYSSTGTETFKKGITYGINAFLRYYLWEDKFFIGISLGYHNQNNFKYTYDAVRSSPLLDVHAVSIAGLSAIALTGEHGLKINLGKKGMFFFQPGCLYTFMVGTKNYDYTGTSDLNTLPRIDQRYYGVYIRIYLGMGWAF